MRLPVLPVLAALQLSPVLELLGLAAGRVSWKLSVSALWVHPTFHGLAIDCGAVQPTSQ